MNPRIEKRQTRRRKWRLFSLLVGLLLFILVIQGSGSRSTLDALLQIDGRYLLLSCTAFVVASLIRIAKWHMMQSYLDLSLSFGETSRVYFDTRVGGLVTPLRGGEVVPALLSRYKSELLSITLFDRAAEGFRMLVVVLVVLVSLSQHDTLVSLQSAFYATVIFFVLFVLLLTDRRVPLWFLKKIGWCLDRVKIGKLGQWIGAWMHRLTNGIDRFYDSVRVLWTPGRSLLLLAMTFMAWFFDIFMNLFIFYAVGFPLPIGAVIICVVLFSASNFIAPTPSGLGVGDLVLVTIVNSLGYEGNPGPFLIVSRSLVVALTFAGYFVCHGATLLLGRGSDVGRATSSRD